MVFCSSQLRRLRYQAAQNQESWSTMIFTKDLPEKDPLRSNGGGETNIFPSFSETNFVIAGITLSGLMHLTIIIFCIKVSFSSHSPGKGISYG